MIRKIRYLFALTSKKRFHRYLKRKGVIMGKNIHFKNRKTVDIDLTRPWLIEIGDNVYFNKNFTLLTHDAVSRLYKIKYNDFLPLHSTGKVKIGNNVAFAREVTVLKGVTIGDNVFIGHGSLVSKDIPSNCIAVGRPAKAVCTIDEYYEKSKKKYAEEVKDNYFRIKNELRREPTIEDFKDEYSLFVNGNKIDDFLDSLDEKVQKKMRKQMGDSYENYKKNHQSMFDGFDHMVANF
ncbi:acyltransferase [Marinifilum sp. D714]|uniref:acyltransferase n=1 Tax=Marinifilum sp. D714 TaxID=2937523 RepID=UPI0027C6EA50|nr:acyltransferase [Marinifilum sp. D714]MDQ2177951.1 acyltransferase [Marinifilum sp. D714]